MSLFPVNHISDNWIDKMFLQNFNFSMVMNRDRHQGIRCMMRFYPMFINFFSWNDPLWYSPPILCLFRRNTAILPVPSSVMSFDENTIRCKGCTSATGCMNSNPIKLICNCMKTGARSQDIYTQLSIITWGANAKLPDGTSILKGPVLYVVRSRNILIMR